AEFPLDRPPVETAEEALSEIMRRQRALEEAFAANRATETRAPRPRWAESRPQGGAREETKAQRTHHQDIDLDQQIRTLSRQLEMMRRPCAFDESVAALRHDLGNIGDALAKAMPRCTLDALESEVQSLAHRVDRGRDRHADGPGLAAIERKIEKLQRALTGL